jgi:membrane-bound lytic murein transglycosylase D
MSRAVSSLSTSDISEIVAHYRGPSFGFASRNFYTEFLAVLEILDDYTHYFGDVNFMTPEEYEVLHIDRPTKINAITAACSLADIRRLNPDLKSSVMASKASLPGNYRLKLPPGTKDSLKYHVKTDTPPTNEPVAGGKTQKADAPKKPETAKPESPKADTAKTEHAKSEALKNDKKAKVEAVAKGVDKPKPQVKQTPDTSKKPDDKPKTAKQHKVKTGQTLYSIAKMYNLTVKDLMKVNSIGDPEKVKTGKVLNIPKKG